MFAWAGRPDLYFHVHCQSELIAELAALAMHLEQSAHAPAGLLISKPLWGVA